MSPRRGGLAVEVPLAAVAAATTWVALWSWAGFTEVPGHFLGPLFWLALVVAGTGALARWARLPGVAAFALQVLASGMVCSLVLSGSPVPVGQAWVRLSEAVSAAVDSANKYAAPVPDDVPGVHALLIPGGLLCLLLVDLLACTLRRVPLAGLPLLMVYSIPVSLLGGGVNWMTFLLTASGFLAMLFLQERDQVRHWGRQLGQTPAEADASAYSWRTGTAHTSAGAIGSVAMVLALFVPLLIPTLELHLLGGGQGGGAGNEISIKNPMADLRRDLNRGEDIPLLRVDTDDPAPSYLRISVLNRFSDNEWSSGDRDVPARNLASGVMPALVGVSASVPRTEYHYEVAINSSFSSTWLPTQAPITQIGADGDWRYDPSTMDFIAADDSLTTAGMHYSMTGVRLQYNVADMAKAPATAGLVSRDYLALPTGLPEFVRTLTSEVTRDAPTRFEKAVALQTWFSRTGGFTYDIHAAPGNGVNDLVAFLTDGNGGRTGYCEQFASSMAVMARVLGIPARVAVGFLSPDKVGPHLYEYSAHDLHAWPELFFPGSGWVRFEPTPAGAGTSVPGYTTQQVPVGNPTVAPTVPRESQQAPSRAPSESASTQDTAKKKGATGVAAFPWVPVAGGLAALALLAGLALLPRSVRRSRRERNLAGGPEAAWAELRATALDLGIPWPHGRSPRETRRRLVRYLGAPVGDQTLERPPHGADVAPEAVHALDRIVGILERSRYARSAGPTAPLREDLETVLAALMGGAARGARRRAEWWPRSVVSGPGSLVPAAPQAPVEARYGGVVDHVG